MNTSLEPDTREAMIEAARQLLVRGGIDALSMRKVGQAVGMSAAAIYRHFEDKDALLSAAVTRGAQTFGAYLLDALAEPTPLGRLQRMGERYFDFAADHRNEYQVLFMLDCEGSNMTKLDERAKRETQATFLLLVDRVVECQKSEDIISGDPRGLAVYIWSAYHGLVSLRISARLDASDEMFSLLVQQQIYRTLSSLRPEGAPPLPRPNEPSVVHASCAT